RIARSDSAQTTTLEEDLAARHGAGGRCACTDPCAHRIQIATRDLSPDGHGGARQVVEATERRLRKLQPEHARVLVAGLYAQHVGGRIRGHADEIRQRDGGTEVEAT